MNDTSADKKETDWTRVAPVLDEALDALSERDRTAILLRFVHHQAFAEMGRALQLSEDAARMRVERALEKLQRLLARRGITSWTVALGVTLADHAIMAAPAGLAATATGHALGAAAATTLPLSGGVIFMNLSKLTSLIVGGALAIAVMGIALHERSKRHDAQSALTLARTEDAARQSELSDLQRLGAEASRTVTGLQSTLAELRAAQAAEKQARPPWNGLEEGAKFLARHPEVGKALAEVTDAENRASYGAMLKALNLTPAEIDQFLAIMRGDSMRGFDFGPDGQSLLMRVGADIPHDERTAQVRALLGEDRFKQYQEFTRGMMSRDAVTQIGSDLAFTETPLTVAQAAPLVDLINRNRFTPPGVRMKATDWPAVIAQAQGLLSGPQLAALEKMSAREAAQIEERRKSAPTPGPAQTAPSQR